MMKKKTLGVSFFALVFLITTGIAHGAYINWYSAVDGGEIRWGGTTTYLSSWNSAVSTWNALGEINIAPDNAYTYEDLKLSDVNSLNYDWLGQYGFSLSTDTLKFNVARMQNKTNSPRLMTATHELGHALGLAHSYSGNVMVDALTSQTSLGTQDKHDYNYLWGN